MTRFGCDGDGTVFVKADEEVQTVGGFGVHDVMVGDVCHPVR
jgi:hypothetical protein